MSRMLRMLVLVGLGAASSLHAQEQSSPEEKVHFSDDYNKCMDAADGATRPVVECDEAERARWEKRLTLAYETLVKKSADDDKVDPLSVESGFKAGTSRVGLLRAAERAWIVFRDADCQSQAATNGSIRSIIYAGCELNYVAERALLLEKLPAD